MASSSKAALSVVAEGWRRVATFPAGLLALVAATAVATAPAALAVQAAIERHLGESAVARRVADGVDLTWWQEFASSGATRRSFSPTLIGGAAPASTYSDLLDGHGPPIQVVTTVVVTMLLWLFLSGGLLDRYARRRRVGSRMFFGTCGVFFFRFLRLTLVTGLGYAVLFGPVHAWLFDGLHGWLTKDTTVERTAFLWRLLLYAVWLIPVLLLNVIADYAKVRAVIEDRHSMIGALSAAARFVARHPAAVAGTYALNAVLAAGLLAAYILLAPSGRGGDWRLALVLIAGGVYLTGRLAIRLAFLTSAMTLFERALAHAEYTAPPLPVWPDSPAAEAIENLRR